APLDPAGAPVPPVVPPPLVPAAPAVAPPVPPVAFPEPAVPLPLPPVPSVEPPLGAHPAARQRPRHVKEARRSKDRIHQLMSCARAVGGRKFARNWLNSR